MDQLPVQSSHSFQQHSSNSDNIQSANGIAGNTFLARQQIRARDNSSSRPSNSDFWNRTTASESSNISVAILAAEAGGFSGNNTHNLNSRNLSPLSASHVISSTVYNNKEDLNCRTMTSSNSSSACGLPGSSVSTTPHLAAYHQRVYPNLDQSIMPLPTVWSPKDKYSLLDVSHGNTIIRYIGQGKNDSDAASVRANYPIPPACGVFYYEVKIVSKGRDGYIGIGLCACSVSLNRLPGWEKSSYGYHGDDGHSFNCSGTGAPYGPTFTTGDVIGCCVNFIDNTCFYTKNGIYLGVAFRDLKPQLYPSVGLRTPGEVLEVNFGQKEFEFDIEGYISETQQKVKTNMIDSFVLEDHLSSSLQGALSRLVCSYLVHHGYSETAAVFSRSTNEDISEELVSIKNRQRIKEYVLSGDIDKVIELCQELYPSVLDTNPDLLFQLKCRKFIELVKNSGATSGTDAIETMMSYGQQLQAICDEDNLGEDKSKYLQEAFSLLAYPDPENSPVAYLLKPSQREPLATALNSAILESQALPSHPPLEVIVQQAGVVLQEALRNNSSAASFVRIEDYF